MAAAHITLIGFMGSGKSTVARLVADRLGWDAVDTDDFVESEAGKTIAAIFDEEGELAFRQREARAFEALKDRDRVAVAAGGASSILPETRRAIAAAGLVIHLEASPEAIVARLEAQQDAAERPMLAGTNPVERVRRLWSQRAALYSLADFTVHTDGLSPEEVAEEVVRLYQLYGERTLSRSGRIEALTATPSILPPVTDAPGAATIVRTASGEYPAYANWGALDSLGDYVKRATASTRAFVIGDRNVLAHWGEPAVSSLRSAGIEATSFTLQPGDVTKSIDTAASVYNWLAGQRAERRDAIVALGGGMTGDFAGFVAGTYLRGMPVVQVPTSLLAMVDASIGGKTAVNLTAAKNLVGLFYQPKAVVADVATLKTLPRRELVEGFGEVIKHALIRDESLLDLLEERLDDLLALDPELTTEVIRRNIRIKGAIVSEDERETGGVRELLNYGHTLGHAFEAAGGYEALLHGEAVSVGMIAAAEIGARMGITPRDVVERQNRLIERVGLPLRPPAGLDRARIQAALALDKKIIAGGQRWILLEAVGRPVVRADVPVEVVESVLDDLLK
jgi:3-dehydroquinate synthase